MFVVTLPRKVVLMDESARRRGTPAVNPAASRRPQSVCYILLWAAFCLAVRSISKVVLMDESARRSDLFRDPTPF